jgi:hypothetical protein
LDIVALPVRPVPTDFETTRAPAAIFWQRNCRQNFHRLLFGSGRARGDKLTIVAVELVFVPVIPVVYSEIRGRDHAGNFPPLDRAGIFTAVPGTNGAPADKPPL